jgi:hypothetical protein
MQSPLRHSASRALFVLAGALAPLFVATPALAQMVDAGERGSLVFDDLSGFRASSIGGLGYAGPIGVSVQSLNEATIGGANGDTTTNHYTNFWFAPSVDVFVINHLSVGGLVEVAVTSASVDTTLVRLGTTTSASLPTTTDVTLLPRVGWLFDITKRFGIWPRLGLGWGERQIAQPNGGGTTSFNAFLLDIDCGFVYRVTNDWFIRAAPEFTYGPGSHSVTNGNTDTSASANLVAFSVAGGFGYMWNR